LDEEAILVDFRGFTIVKEVGMLVARGIEILAARKV
jgi:multisubunit Na+/H+ antiporter MnhB subunit